MKCNLSFISSYANLEGVGQVSIDNCLAGSYNLNGKTFRCIPGNHELIMVNCTQRRSHFRHKHSSDTGGEPMTYWHSEWQSNFPDTEKWFRNQYNQIKDRRADVLIDEFNRIIEIQHSPIEQQEVNNRNKDYSLHNKDVMWLIDSQNSVVIKKLGDRTILEFVSNRWLYESFKDCEYVYYDISGFMYRVKPSDIRSHQIDVGQPMDKQTFIDKIKTMQEFWHHEDIPQAYITIMQKGPGSGKTYSIMQELNTNSEIIRNKHVIFISKQHSAVNVMYTEFMNQYTKGALNNLEIIEEKNEKKKFIVSYRHKDSLVVTIAIFATVDSLTCALGDKSRPMADMFKGIVTSIKEGVCRVNSNGALRYADVNPLINKECIIMIDETQDLSELYGEAFLRVVSSTHTNMCVVGDRLQSLKYNDNALTFLHRAQQYGLKVVNEEASNVVRRFSNPVLIDFVNSIVPYEKYDLPCMTSHKIVERDDSALTIYSGKTIYADQSIECEEVITAVSNTMEYYKHEVETNNCYPEDFLIVTPFTKKNPLVEALQLAINEYWKENMEKYKHSNEFWRNIDTTKYNRYAVFHKSEDMGSINLAQSEHATRMVSIHTSKGDGRRIVFVIGVTESSLQRFSQISGNLIYDSLLNVSITRQKEKLYFRLEKNGDDVHKRISKTNTTISCSSTFNFQNKKIKLEYITGDIIEFSYDDINSNMISAYDMPILSSNDEKKLLIDMGDHNIRYASMFMNIVIHICNHEYKTQADVKHQFYAILYRLKPANITVVSDWADYMKEVSSNNKNPREKYCIPVLKFSRNSEENEYTRIYEIIRLTMQKIMDKLKELNKAPLKYLCPLECVVLYYMIECIENGKYQAITINDLYNIIDTYTKVFDSSATGHEHCECKKHFSSNLGILTIKQKDQLEYLRSHYDRLQHVCTIMDSFIDLHPNINWLYETGVKYDKKEFNIHTGISLHGYDNKQIYVFYIKPEFNELNFSEFKVQSIFDSWLLSKQDNSRYVNKTIVSYVLSLNHAELYTINWTQHIKNYIDYLTNLMYSTLYKMFSIKHEQYFDIFKNIRDIEGPLICIKKCKEQVKEDPNLADYISDFWAYLEGKIEDFDNKKEQKEFIASYTKEDFIKRLDSRLDKSLMAYFNLEESE